MLAAAPSEAVAPRRTGGEAVATAADGGVAPAEAEGRTRARAAVGHLVSHVEVNRSRPSLRGLDAGEVAINFAQYVDGLAVGLEALDAEQRAAVAEDIGDRICDPGVDRATVHLLTLLELRMPAVASDRALDCALGGVTDEQDPLLPLAVDAWRGAGIEPTGAFEAWQDAVTTPELRARFSGEAAHEELRRRMPEGE